MRSILVLILFGLTACGRLQKPIEQSQPNTGETQESKTSLKTDSVYSFKLRIDTLHEITIKREYVNHSNYHQTFYLNNEKIYTDTTNYLVDSSKYSRVIAENGNVLLFMECDGRPNLDYISAYAIDIKNKKMTYLSSSVFNDGPGGKTKPFTDIDGDGFLEYGGFDLSEMHPHPDSMYYNPSKFYEIKKGRLLFDSLLTKKEDIKENGIYLAQPLDKNGNCCKVIKRPKYKR